MNLPDGLKEEPSYDVCGHEAELAALRDQLAGYQVHYDMAMRSWNHCLHDITLLKSDILESEAHAKEVTRLLAVEVASHAETRAVLEKCAIPLEALLSAECQPGCVALRVEVQQAIRDAVAAIRQALGGV